MRTKKAGITFYTTECSRYLTNIWDGHDGNVFQFSQRAFIRIWRKVSASAGIKITPQVLWVWHATTLGELGIPDRYVDIFQGRAPRSVLAKHYTGSGFNRLKRIYEKANLKVLT
jgi:intergrase/recombinase